MSGKKEWIKEGWLEERMNKGWMSERRINKGEWLEERMNKWWTSERNNELKMNDWKKEWIKDEWAERKNE